MKASWLGSLSLISLKCGLIHTGLFKPFKSLEKAVIKVIEVCGRVSGHCRCNHVVYGH